MKDSTPHLITAAEFNAQVRSWASEIKGMAQATLATGTHGTGQLRDRFAAFVDATRHTDPAVDGQGEAPAYKVKFGFDRYGVFRAYGVGRGWVRVGGALVRGFRARSESEIRNKTWNIFTTELRRQGLTSREINTFKFLDKEKDTGKVRTPLDWLDQHINRRINELAEKGSFGPACAFATILIVITYGAVLLMNFVISRFGTSAKTATEEE